MHIPKFWIVLLFLLALGYSYKNDLLNLYLKVKGELPKIEQVANSVTSEVKKEVNTPPPLRAQKEVPTAFLTVAGTINHTNIQREKNGFKALKENSTLDQSAKRKLDDMFANQYFAHEAPNGKNIDDLAQDVGYSYIAIGENLALGNFDGDAVLVTAWMDSPGHRANILSAKYTEIGVAVGRGTYEGRQTWLAVQHFGKPLSACTQPDSSIKAKIESLKAAVDQKATELETKRQNLDQSNKNEVDEYNREVEEYNGMVRELKSLIDQYNNQVASFNTCASS